MNGDLDAAFVVITFDNGSVGNAYINWAYPTNANTGIWASLEVIGAEGFGTVDTRNQGCEIGTDTAGSYPDALYWPEYLGKINVDLPAELIHYADATLNNKEYAVNTESCIYGVAIAEAALKSISTGEVVELSL